MKKSRDWQKGLAKLLFSSVQGNRQRDLPRERSTSLYDAVLRVFQLGSTCNLCTTNPKLSNVHLWRRQNLPLTLSPRNKHFLWTAWHQPTMSASLVQLILLFFHRTVDRTSYVSSVKLIDSKQLQQEKKIHWNNFHQSKMWLNDHVVETCDCLVWQSVANFQINCFLELQIIKREAITIFNIRCNSYEVSRNP